MKPIIQTQLAAEGENSATIAGLIAEAEVEVNPPYRELRIGVKNEADKYVADILVGLCLDCGKDCFDDVVARGEFAADCREDR